MSFDFKTLNIGGLPGAVGQVSTYSTTDLPEVVEAAGYFQAAAPFLGPNDLLTVLFPTASRLYQVQRRSSGIALTRLRSGLPPLLPATRVLDAPATLVVAPSLTVVAGSTSTITNSRLIARGDPAFELLGGDVVPYGATAPDDTMNVIRAVTTVGGRAHGMAIEFMFDGDAFEVATKAVGASVRLLVDGSWASEVATPLGNGGGLVLLKVTFASPGVRHIRLEAGGYVSATVTAEAPFGGVWASKLHSAWRTRPGGHVRAVFLGDSYCDSRYTEQPLDNWAYWTCRHLGWREPWVCGVGGTGYTTASVSGSRFGDRLGDFAQARPDVIVIAGGINDLPSWGAEGRSARARAMYDDLREAHPTAPIFVLGPYQLYSPIVGGLANINNELRAAAAGRDGFTYIENFADYWVTGDKNASGLALGTSASPAGLGNQDLYIRSDRLHPTALGHRYYGRRVAAVINERLRSL